MKAAFGVLAIVSMMALPLVAQAESVSSGKSKETSREEVQPPVVPPAPPVSGQMMPSEMGGMPMPGMPGVMPGQPGMPGIPGQPMSGGTTAICGPCCQEMMGDKMALKQMLDTITRLEVQISKMQEVIEKKTPAKK